MNKTLFKNRVGTVARAMAWAFLGAVMVLMGAPVLGQSSITNLGPLNINHGVSWDTPDLTNRTDLVGWEVKVYPKGVTNGPSLATNFVAMSYVTNLSGIKSVMVPATFLMTNLANGPKNISVATVAQANLKSNPAFAEVDFNNGQLKMAGNVRLWEFITAVASQSLSPPVP